MKIFSSLFRNNFQAKNLCAPFPRFAFQLSSSKKIPEFINDRRYRKTVDVMLCSAQAELSSSRNSQNVYWRQSKNKSKRYANVV